MKISRRLGRSALAFGAAALFAACGSCPRSSPDFATPSAAVRSMQAALGQADSLGLYRCLSEGLKERTDLGALGTDIALEHLLREYPEIEYLEEGEIVAERRLGPDHALVEVEVGFLFFTRLVRFVLERRTLAELIREETPAPIGVFLAPGARVANFAQVDPEQPDIQVLLRDVPDLWEQLQISEPPITSFQVTDVWKVHAIAVDEGEVPAAPTTPRMEDGSP
jgi:hypothetical protein